MPGRPTVVVGLDGSAESWAALTYAIEDAARRGSGVEVVSVFLPPQYRPESYGLVAPPTCWWSGTEGGDASPVRCSARWGWPACCTPGVP